MSQSMVPTPPPPAWPESPFLTEHEGDLLERLSPEVAIGHGVNVVGVMGAGIAYAFAKKYPEMESYYVDICNSQRLQPGTMLPWNTGDGYVFNMASQVQPGADADYGLLDLSVQRSIQFAKAIGLEALALPRIGCGIGGLEWTHVRSILRENADYYEFPIEVWTLPEQK